MKYSSIIKANGIIIALSIVLLAIFSDKLIPDTKTVHLSGKYKFDEEVTVNGKR